MGETGKRTREKGNALHTAANVIGIVLCVVFIPLIIFNMVLIIRSYINPDKLPTVFGVSPVIVLSGSMWPEFNAGDMILVQETDPAALREGDVICYFADGPENAVTHRIVEIQDREGQRVFVTRGDANNTEDTIVVTSDMVQGKYMGIYIAGLGNVAVFLQSTPGMLLCILTPLGLFLLWDAFRRMVSSRKEKEEAAAAQAETESMEEELRRLRAQMAQRDQSGTDRSDDPRPPAAP